MPTDVRTAIVASINRIRTESGRSTVTPQDADLLAGDLGLDSLDLAVLVVSLEKELGTDPFREGNATARTLGEVVDLYQKALTS